MNSTTEEVVGYSDEEQMKELDWIMSERPRFKQKRFDKNHPEVKLYACVGLICIIGMLILSKYFFHYKLDLAVRQVAATVGS